jgi:hypothetical protein
MNSPCRILWMLVTWRSSMTLGRRWILYLVCDLFFIFILSKSRLQDPRCVVTYTGLVLWKRWVRHLPSLSLSGNSQCNTQKQRQHFPILHSNAARLRYLRLPGERNLERRNSQSSLVAKGSRHSCWDHHLEPHVGPSHWPLHDRWRVMKECESVIWGQYLKIGGNFIRNPDRPSHSVTGLVKHRSCLVCWLRIVQCIASNQVLPPYLSHCIEQDLSHCNHWYLCPAQSS